MKRIIQWIVFNSIFATSMYYSYFENVIGAERIVIAFIVLMFLSAMSAQTDNGKEIYLKKSQGKRSVPYWIDIPVDVIYSLIFIWFGSWILATLFIYSCIVINHINQLFDPEIHKKD